MEERYSASLKRHATGACQALSLTPTLVYSVHYLSNAVMSTVSN